MAAPRGRGGIMEPSAACREGVSVRQLFDCLTDVYSCFLTESCPKQSAADVAGLIFCGVCGLVPTEDRECVRAEYGPDRQELAYISATLVEKMSSSLMSQSLPPAVEAYLVEILRALFEDMDLMSRLVSLFQAEDQIMSHLAAKSVSKCVSYHLHKSGSVSPVWERKCVQAFHSSPPSTELDACLWTLTDVLKRLLKGAHQDILGKLLEVFDSSICALCSKFLPEVRQEVTQCLDFTSSRRWGTTFCLLLDLLEVLAASSWICGAGDYLRSQRMLHIHSSALLTTVTCSSQFFVKKRALLLLKRAVLQKAGEDWALGQAQLSGLKYTPDSDMSSLAQTVLTAVGANWLERVEVESASFCGGTRHTQWDGGQKPDCVTLRAVSLLLLKSLELHIQTACGTAAVGSATEVCGYLQSLWGFLRRCNVQLMRVTHLCCWVSLLFGEQDDDMMEAAKALLSIFLHYKLCSGLDDPAALEAACAFGCNPHCHFLLLLQSISFDHSILLDFLISTETCYLEYLVRYLKYLRADWQGFIAACRRISTSSCPPSLQKSHTASCGDTCAPTCVQPTGGLLPVEMISMASGLRLVDYGSSDESDPESMDVSPEQRVTSVCEQNPNALDVKQEINGPPAPIREEQSKSSDSTGLLSKSNSTLERPPGSSVPVLQSEQTTSCPNMAPLSGQGTCETLARAVLCLSELRGVVTRLQAKKLFPYNPSSLLKLLVHVENCSQQSHLSQFNKQ